MCAVKQYYDWLQCIYFSSSNPQELLNVLFARLEDKCLEYRHDEFKYIVDILKVGLMIIGFKSGFAVWIDIQFVFRDFKSCFFFLLPDPYQCYDNMFIKETGKHIINFCGRIPTLVSDLSFLASRNQEFSESTSAGVSIEAGNQGNFATHFPNHCCLLSL